MKNKYLKKAAVLAMTGIIAAGSLAACGSDKKDESANAENAKELSMAWWGNQVRNERTQQVLDKYKEETDGFDGFLVRAELLKCRTNNAGKTCDMVYNQRSGFDPVLTLFKFIDDGGLVEGRNPYRYFKDFSDIKFDSRKFTKEFKTNPELRKAMITISKPILQSMLARPNSDFDNIDLDEDFTV